MTITIPKKHVLAIGIAGLVLLATGLVIWVRRDRAFTNDPWYAPGSPHEGNNAHLRITREASVQFKHVLPECRQTACEMLAKEQILALDGDTAARLAGLDPNGMDGSPYLVRGLAFVSGTAGTSAFFREGSLYVVGGALGSGWPKVVRMPVVVWLKSPPARVFVELSMCE